MTQILLSEGAEIKGRVGVRMDAETRKKRAVALKLREEQELKRAGAFVEKEAPVILSDHAGVVSSSTVSSKRQHHK